MAKPMMLLALYSMVLSLAAGQMDGAEVRGKVRSTAGVPLRQAVVTLSMAKFGPAVVTAEVRSDGTFTLLTNKLGGVTITVAAPNHVATIADVFLPSSNHVVDVDVALATNRNTSALEGVKILGEFNEWDFEEAPSMERLADGTFGYTLPVKNGTAAYQVLMVESAPDENAEPHSVNGTQYDRLEYDGGGDFRSIITAKGSSIRVVFDPSKLPESSGQAAFTFTSPSEADLQRIVEQVRNPLLTIRGAASQRATTEQEFFDIIFNELAPAELSALHQQLQDNMTDSKRQLLTAKGLGLMRWSERRTAKDTALVLGAMGQIPTDSKVWYLAVGHLVDAYGSVGNIEEAVGAVRTITKSMGDDGSDQLAWAMYRVCQGVERKRPELFASTYAQLVREFPDHPAAQQAKTSWDPSKKIVVGKPLPDFAYPSLDNPGVVVTPASLKGKWVLIDLWATWCGPCVAEMPTIMKAWEEFKNDNVMFLSISLDQSADKIAPFREKRFSMPWLHVYREGVFKSDASTLFEVTGIPKPILVSPEGVITHITNGLRGPALLTTLKKAVRGE